MDHNEHRKLQQQIIDQVMAILNGDPRVLGVVYAGSYARGNHDAFSDLDLACYLRDEARTGREELHAQVAAIAPTLWHLYIYDLHALYLYGNGVRLDIDFCKPSQLASTSEVYTDMRLAYDPDGVLAKALSKTSEPLPAAHPQWFEPGDPDMIDWFFWMFRQIVCWAKRSQQADYRAFDKLANAIQSLADVRTRLIEMRLYTLGRKDYYPHADPASAGRMAQTYPHFDPVEVIQCTRRLLAEYEAICPPYCQKTGAIYPAHKVEVMYGLIEEFDGLDAA